MMGKTIKKPPIISRIPFFYSVIFYIVIGVFLITFSLSISHHCGLIRISGVEWLQGTAATGLSFMIGFLCGANIEK